MNMGELGRQKEAGLGFHTLQSTSYKDQAYQMIKDAILYRRFKVGQVYSQDSVGSEMGISRTPVREALLELQQEGYVSFLRGRGFAVVPVTAEDARDIVEMRHYVELAGSKLAARRRTSEHLARMEQSLTSMRSELKLDNQTKLYKLDREFHRAIFEAAGNRRLLRAMEELRDNFLRFETLTAFDSLEQSREVLDEHAHICEAISDGDAELAEKLMNVHMEKTVARTVREVLG